MNGEGGQTLQNPSANRFSIRVEVARFGCQWWKVPFNAQPIEVQLNAESNFGAIFRAYVCGVCVCGVCLCVYLRVFRGNEVAID